MKALLDTSFLVAALIEGHPRHGAACEALETLPGSDRFMAQHSMAELYSVLTTYPISPRARPDDAMRMIHQLLQTLGVVALDAEDYENAISRLSDLGLSGGVVYDALIVRAAIKIGADQIWTLNPRDFTRIAPELASSIRTV